jgi:hypothetical protein
MQSARFLDEVEKRAAMDLLAKLRITLGGV